MRRFVFLLCLTLALAGCTGGERMTGTGTQADPYIITTRADLEAINNDLTAYYELGADISLSGADWTPLASSSPFFTGSLDGKNHKITGLVIHQDAPSLAYVGLFAQTDTGCVIKNLTICGAKLQCDFTGNYYVLCVGALVGYGVGTFTDCQADLTVTATADANGSVLYPLGGMFGYCKGASVVTRCKGSLTMVTATGLTSLQGVGGLAGSMEGTSGAYLSCIDCQGTLNMGTYGGILLGGFAGYAFRYLTFSGCKGTITVNATTAAQVGGFTGRMYQAGTATDCSASGSISANGDYHGGFVGWMNQTVKCQRCSSSTDLSTTTGKYHGGFVGWNGQVAGDAITSYNKTVDCYAIGDVDGDAYVGGFSGYTRISKESATPWYGHEHCYSMGAVSGNSSVGGFCGAIESGALELNCYWDTQTSGQASSALGTGKTTAQMQTQGTFTDWDFSTVWNIASGTYPFLRTAFVTLTDKCAAVVHSFPWIGRFQLCKVTV